MADTQQDPVLEALQAVDAARAALREASARLRALVKPTSEEVDAAYELLFEDFRNQDEPIESVDWDAILTECVLELRTED